MKLRPARRNAILYAALASFIVLSIYFLVSRSTRVVDAAVPPDNTTPAGKLVVDATTGWPAIAPLTMTFVHSPDADGPGGKGRYLIAINSGYGIEFTSKSRQQQT